MTCNNSVTVYKYNDDEEVYTRNIYRAYVFETRRNTDAGNVSSSGRSESSRVIIRIPTSENLNIVPGNRIVIGDCTDEKPPKDKYYRVTVCGDRRYGINPHWRLECE